MTGGEGVMYESKRNMLFRVKGGAMKGLVKRCLVVVDKST